MNTKLPPRIRARHNIPGAQVRVCAGAVGVLSESGDHYYFPVTGFDEACREIACWPVSVHFVNEEDFEFLWPRKVRVPVVTPLAAEPRILEQGEWGIASEYLPTPLFHNASNPESMAKYIPCRVEWKEVEVDG